MGVLYELCQRLMTEVEARNPDPIALLRAKGELARTAGFMVSMVSAGDPDDPQRIERVRIAARGAGIEI